MNNSQNLKMSIEGISYLDFSDFMKVPAGVILKNESYTIPELFNFIEGKCCFEKPDSYKNYNKLQIVELDQKHTNTVIKASEGIRKSADGIYESSANFILIVKTADCFPVFLSDGETVGLLHVGWRGCLTGIIDNFFKEVRSFKHRKAKVAIGPGIGRCCFEASPEVALLLDKKYRLHKDGKFYIDLQGLIVDELAKNKIEYIIKNEACTVCNKDRFYSYRREGKDVKQMFSYICTGE
jgi:YfiH family protein